MHHLQREPEFEDEYNGGHRDVHPDSGRDLGHFDQPRPPRSPLPGGDRGGVVTPN